MQWSGPGQRHRRLRTFAACDGPGSGRGRHPVVGARSGSADASLAARTTARALLVAGAYVAQDVRDPDGLVRPMLRRAAQRLAVSRRPTLRRLGCSYLRGDPPTPKEVTAPLYARALPAADTAASVDTPTRAPDLRGTIDIGPPAFRGAI
jgi:hypothetical protein